MEEILYCPECNAEYRPGFETCSDCDIPLVKGIPPEIVNDSNKPVVKEKLVTVYSTSNPALIAMVKSLLNSYQIIYCTAGENVQNLFGLGILGTGYNVVTGAVRIMVSEEKAEFARDLLKDIEASKVDYDSAESIDELTEADEIIITRKCPQCGSTIHSSDDVCKNCGIEIELCMNCGYPVVSSELECPNCRHFLKAVGAFKIDTESDESTDKLKEDNEVSPCRKCPQCSAEIVSSDEVCKGCNIEVYNCSNCDYPVIDSDLECANCGEKFD